MNVTEIKRREERIRGKRQGPNRVNWPEGTGEKKDDRRDGIEQ
jgi:hypothetical protein